MAPPIKRYFSAVLHRAEYLLPAVEAFAVVLSAVIVCVRCNLVAHLKMVVLRLTGAEEAPNHLTTALFPGQ